MGRMSQMKSQYNHRQYKIPPEKVGRCALCHQTTDLRKSHIIPEFAYKAMYEDNKMIAFEANDVENPWKEQKGLRDRLLCDSCEGFLNRAYEEPFKKFWFDHRILATRPVGKVVMLRVPDYAAFKLFHLSILWRASVCRNPFFGYVRLGPHEERLRLMLRARDPGRAGEYPISCAAVFHESGVADNFIASPQRFRYKGYRGYHFTFAGCEWRYFITPDENPTIAQFGLRENGELPVIRRTLEDAFWTLNAVSLGMRRPGEFPLKGDSGDSAAIVALPDLPQR